MQFAMESLVFNEVNAKGGVNGLQLEAIFLDDKFQPNLTQKHVKTLKSQYDCDILLCPFGCPVVSLIPKVKNKELLVAFPYDGSMELRDPELKYMLNIRPSCYHEGYALIKYAHENLKGKRVAIFYMDSSYGKSGLAGAQQALKDLGITEWLETSHLPNSMDVENSVEKIKTFNPDTILFCSIHEPANELIRQLGVINVVGKNLLGIHPHGYQRATLKKLGFNIIVTRIVPNWKDDSIQLIQEYNTHIKNASCNPSFASLEGFIAASVFVDALKKVVGEITNDKIVEAIESMKNYNLKGLELNFKPEIRTLGKLLWIDVADDQPWIPVNIKFGKA